MNKHVHTQLALTMSVFHRIGLTVGTSYVGPFQVRLISPPGMSGILHSSTSLQPFCCQLLPYEHCSNCVLCHFSGEIA
uniref:Uncharacterized protein n=1 Tax=Anguilla anguilla TaxID=7936 RepID=A0A0E9UVC7_ANGAN